MWAIIEFVARISMAIGAYALFVTVILQGKMIEKNIEAIEKNTKAIEKLEQNSQGGA